MELTPEIKAQLAEQKKQCIHCKLISGEIPNAKKVFEDDKVLALTDIYPVVKGHVVDMLKEHYPMPAYVSGEDFKHKFSLIPGLSKAIKSAMVRTGINVYMAIGGAAGQQSYHFLAHLLPREEGDKLYNFLFKKGNGKLSEGEIQNLQRNFSVMMNNHFGRNPAQWHIGKGAVPSYLKTIYEKSEVVYEDEKILCVIPNEAAAKGHLMIYSKVEEKYVEKLSQEDSAHLFFAASLASTALFEGLQAQGTNILLKSGECDDNTAGKLAVYIFPRWQDDGLSLQLEGKQATYDLDKITKEIKDKTWMVKYGGGKKEKKKEEVAIPKVIKIEEKKEKKSEEKKDTSAIEEIREAIENYR
ncbi:MAG: HIT domain-containing protein [Nanoarchaeota archaeon]